MRPGFLATRYWPFIISGRRARQFAQPWASPRGNLARWAENNHVHVTIPQGDALGWANKSPLGANGVPPEKLATHGPRHSLTTRCDCPLKKAPHRRKMGILQSCSSCRCNTSPKSTNRLATRHAIHKCLSEKTLQEHTTPKINSRVTVLLHGCVTARTNPFHASSPQNLSCP